MSHSQPDPLVEAVVEKVFPFGVFVRLDDGTPAYIRRRELAVDRDVNPAEVVQEGQRISAMVIHASKTEKLLELSRRQTLGDPWLSFARQFGAGDAVRGTVRAVVPHGVYVRVQAGIDGYVPLEELAPWPVEKPETFLWVEDPVEAIILGMDTAHKQLVLSIKARFQKREQALETYQEMASLLESSPTLGSDPKTGGQISPDSRNKVGPFLVVDDEKEVRISLANWLRDLGLEVSQAATLVEAEGYLQERSYQVIFVDLNLKEEDGLRLANSPLLKGENKPSICVMSSPNWLHTRAEEIEAAGVTHLFAKPLDLDEIENFLLQMMYQKSSFPPDLGERDAFRPETKAITPFRELQGMDRLASEPLDRLKTVLAHLTESLRAALGVVFLMDVLSNAITILAHAGSLPIQREAMYQLGDSPVKDVMAENQPVFETQMNEPVRARFRKLLDLVSFEACIGVPINVQDDGHYAVFFFHRERNAFSRFRLRDAQAGAWLLAALLEEESLKQRLHALHPLLLSGQLAASFGHEVSNKMIALEFKARKLASFREPQARLESEAADLLKVILDLKELVGGFQEMMWRPETRGALEVNASLNGAKNVLKPLLNKEKVKLGLHLAADLPPVFGNRNAIQHVFLNLMLNAIQQMSLMQTQVDGEGHRLLDIRSSLSQNEEMIEVRFSDSGPGIHKRLWEKVFTPGFSTRGGSGLGLYIARSIVQSFGGRVEIEESVIPLGTTFRVEFPVAREG